MEIKIIWDERLYSMSPITSYFEEVEILTFP